MTIIREAVNQGIAALHRSSTPRLDARLLLCAVLNVELTYLLAYPDYELTQEQRKAYQTLINRRSTGEPIAYILRKQSFYNLDLRVTPAVLIPRPETEHLVEEAIRFAQTRHGLTAADIGTGSGAIAIAVAKNVADVTMYATDIDSDALRVARHNARTSNVNITFEEGHLAQPLLAKDVKVDLLMANLPYIRHDNINALEVAKHEPLLALDGGEDGLDHIRALIAQVPQLCTDDAMILLEIGAEQGKAVTTLANEQLAPQAVDVLKDYAKRDRVVRVQL